MAYPVVARGGDDAGGPVGYTYAAVLVRLDPAGDAPAGATCTREEVLAGLAAVRFSGWVGPAEDGWLVAVAAAGGGTVAAGRRGVLDLGAWLAERFAAPVVATRVVQDQQLLLAMWSGGVEVGRYLSDPSYGLGADDDTLPDPFGVEHAAAFAAACGHPAAAEELTEVLAEELSPDSVFESERLASVLGLLGLPTWLVAVASLPRDVPTGPRAREFTRLAVGRRGLAGRLVGWPVGLVRRRLPPPPAVPDPPRGSTDIDPWLL